MSRSLNRRTPIKVVLALGWYFPESTGGTEVYVTSLGTHLKDMGYEPVVIAPFAGEDRQSYEHNHISVFRYPIPANPTREEAQVKAMIGEVMVNQLKNTQLRTLCDAKFKVFSQFGDDGIIQYLVNVLPLPITIL